MSTIITKPKMLSFLKSKGYYILVALLFLALATSSVAYYFLSQKTLKEYENELVTERNAVTTQVDTLTKTLNTAETQEEIETEIKKLEENKDTFQSKLENTELPKNPGKTKELNQKFLTTTEEIITNANQYKDSYENEEIDIVEVLEKYNTSVSDLNEVIEEIKMSVE